jgi:hypothetical protein
MAVELPAKNKVSFSCGVVTATRGECSRQYINTAAALQKSNKSILAKVLSLQQGENLPDNAQKLQYYCKKYSKSILAVVVSLQQGENVPHNV